MSNTASSKRVVSVFWALADSEGENVNTPTRAIDVRETMLIFVIRLYDVVKHIDPRWPSGRRIRKPVHHG